MKSTIYNVKFWIVILMVLCIFGAIKFIIFEVKTFERTLFEYKQEAVIKQQIWYEECLQENKQYKCDYMWAGMYLLD